MDTKLWDLRGGHCKIWPLRAVIRDFFMKKALLLGLCLIVGLGTCEVRAGWWFLSAQWALNDAKKALARDVCGKSLIDFIKMYENDTAGAAQAVVARPTTDQKEKEWLAVVYLQNVDLQLFKALEGLKKQMPTLWLKSSCDKFNEACAKIEHARDFIKAVCDEITVTKAYQDQAFKHQKEQKERLGAVLLGALCLLALF